MFDFFAARDYALRTARSYVEGGAPLDRSAFETCFATNSAYNFVAVPLARSRNSHVL
jgi:hypothetical protein